MPNSPSGDSIGGVSRELEEELRPTQYFGDCLDNTNGKIPIDNVDQSLSVIPVGYTVWTKTAHCKTHGYAHVWRYLTRNPPAEEKLENKTTKLIANVHSPNHYTMGGREVIEIIEDLGLHDDYALGNAVKYIARCRYKNNLIEDLRKAIWYCRRRIRQEKQKRQKREDAHENGIQEDLR